MNLKAAHDMHPAHFTFRGTCRRPVDPWVIPCLRLAACWEGQKRVVLRWSFLHFITHTRAVTGVKINYVSGWKSSYVTGVAANLTAAAHPMGPASHWHGIISAQIRFNFLRYRFYARLSIHFCRSLNSLQRVSHGSSVIDVIFLCNILRSILAELFSVGVCLNGRRMPGAQSTVSMMNVC